MKVGLFFGGGRYFQAGFQLEKLEIVAVHASIRYERRPEQPQRWKHREWHNRGCVWDTLVSEWAGYGVTGQVEENIHALEDNKKFFTFALDSVKHSTIHITRTEEERS